MLSVCISLKKKEKKNQKTAGRKLMITERHLVTDITGA